MNPPTLSHNRTTQFNYTQPAKLFKTLPSLKIAKEQPDQFSSALVHEVRNPLSNINLATQMLKSLTNDDNQKLYLDIILRGSERISSILTDLLTSYKPDEHEAEKYSIHELLDEVLEMAKDRFILKKITVRKNYTAMNDEIAVSRPKMKIALTNIIINAIEAMTSGIGELGLVTKIVDGGVKILIEDNGCGIGKENLKNIFKPYFTNKPGGLGLGLATTYNILRSNCVGVNVESEEGDGTRFFLSFDKNQGYNSFH
jgi:signal transduction histidine kinase